MIKGVILDFDGVIAESVDVKTDAFRSLFREYPKHLDTITRYHISNGGISRFDKFRHIYQNILKEDLPEDKFNELCRHFNELVVNKVIEAPFVEGARQFLDNCHGCYALFVVSATPEAEIKEITMRKDIAMYFDGIYGSPERKADLIKKILKNNNFRNNEVLFIGDSINDLHAAEEAGIRFAGRIQEDGISWLKGSAGVYSFKRFNEIEELLKEWEE